MKQFEKPSGMALGRVIATEHCAYCQIAGRTPAETIYSLGIAPPAGAGWGDAIMAVQMAWAMLDSWWALDTNCEEV